MIEGWRKTSKSQVSAEQRFLLIRSVIEKYELKNMVIFLCEISGESRLGYFNYFS